MRTLLRAISALRDAPFLKQAALGFIKQLTALVQVPDGVVDESPGQLTGSTVEPVLEGLAGLLLALGEGLLLIAKSLLNLSPDGVVEDVEIR